MKPAPFEYLAPASLEDALAILQERGDEAKLLAGGQSLVPAMNFRLAQPKILVDLNKLPGLDYVRQVDGTGVRIGAMTRQRRLEIDPLIAEMAPLLAEAMPYVAHPQIRNRGTLGGSLAYADPAAELPVIALALQARFKLCRAQAERWLPAAEFFQGMFTTALEPDEILVEVELPQLPHGAGWSFMEVARRRGDYALMGVAVLIAINELGICQEARIVYLNAGDGPQVARQAADMLVGEPITQAAIVAAAQTAAENEIDPFGNIHATPEFQRHLAQVLTRRALEKALVRASLPGI